ncbi:MAG: TldD/PmbA family protein [Pseudomonadota bacterium]
MTNFSDLANQVLNAAKQAGADDADVLVVDGTTLSIDVRNGALEHADRSEGVDIGLRVLVGQRQATLSISERSVEAISSMAERAVAMASEAPEDASLGLATEDQLSALRDAQNLELSDTADALTPAELEELAQQAEAAALSVPGVAQSQAATAGLSRTEIWLAATNGFSGGYSRTGTSVSCVAISGEGLSMERDYAAEGRVFAADLPNAEEIGRLAGERAVARHGATRPKTGAYPVLFDERISSSLISHLISAIDGSSIVRGSSWLKDAMGGQVLPQNISLVEEPHRARIAGSRPFDAEGLPTAERVWVQDGILQDWVMDLSSARKLGRAPTGNAARGVSGPPRPSLSNLRLSEGEKTKAELISEMGTGLLVTSMIGATINPNTGDYSRGISGFWIENGEVGGPVNEATIAGNLRDFLPRLIPANDARGHLSRVVPSLLVEGLTLAGV